MLAHGFVMAGRHSLQFNTNAGGGDRLATARLAFARPVLPC
jgi:hypothetical protein